MHVCVKTLEKIINEGWGDPIPALKHLTFISDKVAKGCFNFEAISGYDDAVRATVVVEGYGEFAKIETDEVFGHFSVENTVKKTDVSSKSQGKFKSGGGGGGLKQTAYVSVTTQRKDARVNAILSINAVNVTPINTGRRTVKNLNRILL